MCAIIQVRQVTTDDNTKPVQLENTKPIQGENAKSTSEQPDEKPQITPVSESDRKILEELIGDVTVAQLIEQDELMQTKKQGGTNATAVKFPQIVDRQKRGTIHHVRDTPCYTTEGPIANLPIGDASNLLIPLRYHDRQVWVHYCCPHPFQEPVLPTWKP